MTIAVVGTVFLVNAGSDGSRVAVIEGEVRVRERGTPLRRSGRQGAVDTRLRPGEQVATSPTIARRPVDGGHRLEPSSGRALPYSRVVQEGDGADGGSAHAGGACPGCSARRRQPRDARIRRSVDPRVRPRQSAAGTGWRARRRREQSSDDAGPAVRPLPDAGDADPDRVRLRRRRTSFGRGGRVARDERRTSSTDSASRTACASVEVRTGYARSSTPSRRWQELPRTPRRCAGRCCGRCSSGGSA